MSSRDARTRSTAIWPRRQRFKADTDKAVAEYEKALAEARGKAHAIAQETRDKLHAEVDKERSKLDGELAEKIAAAEKAIQATRSKALASVSEFAADIAADIVSRLTGTSVTKADAGQGRGQGARDLTMFGHAETWVAVAFLLFVALLVYLKVPAKVAALLDERAARIAKELAEAKKLREEAQALLDEYKRKRVQAEKDAEDIVALARREAEAYANETRAKLTETLARRTKQAEQKIAQAEQQAVKDVRYGGNRRRHRRGDRTPRCGGGGCEGRQAHR